MPGTAFAKGGGGAKAMKVMDKTEFNHCSDNQTSLTL